MKKMIVAVVVIAIFIIYLLTVDKKTYYLTLGDELSINTPQNYSKKVEEYLANNNKLELFVDKFPANNYRATDIINDINNNIKIRNGTKNITLKNALIKADLLTISIGMNDIVSGINIKNINLSNNYEFLYDYIDDVVHDLDEMLKLIRIYCKEDIMLVGLYYPFDVQNKELLDIFLYANNKFKITCEKYKVNYIDIYSLFLEHKFYISSEKKLYPSEEGYKVIYEQIVVNIGKKNS